MSSADDCIIRSTENWIREVVIGLRLCPFAARASDENTISFIIVEGDDTEAHLHRLAHHLTELDSDESIETSLLLFPDSYEQFDHYLELLHLSDMLIDELGYRGHYQLASFHPAYIFDGQDKDDASNYTNRSPYPMLHILREASIEQAVVNYPNIDAVPDENIRKLRKLGSDSMQAYLDRCRQDNP